MTPLLPWLKNVFILSRLYHRAAAANVRSDAPQRWPRIVTFCAAAGKRRAVGTLWNVLRAKTNTKTAFLLPLLSERRDLPSAFFCTCTHISQRLRSRASRVRLISVHYLDIGRWLAASGIVLNICVITTAQDLVRQHTGIPATYILHLPTLPLRSRCIHAAMPTRKRQAFHLRTLWDYALKHLLQTGLHALGRWRKPRWPAAVFRRARVLRAVNGCPGRVNHRGGRT